MEKYIELIEKTARSNYETTVKMYSDIRTKLLIVNLAKKNNINLKKVKDIVAETASAADAQHFVAELV